MTRATRSLFAASCLFTAVLAGRELAAQNYQPAPTQTPQQQGAQPARQSVYGPAVAAPAAQPNRAAQPQQNYQVQPAQGQAQPGQVRPVADQQPITGQQPIKQPTNGAIQPGGPLPLGPANVPRAAVVRPMPQEPEWHPLDPKVQEWVDNVLRYWEKRSNEVKTLECKFQKWTYDPSEVSAEFQQLKALGKLHQLPFSKYAKGTIKYAGPDKGLFKVEQLMAIAPGEKNPDSTQKYNALGKENGEHWITDGKRVFAFDAGNKQLIERQLPPEMHGKSLADGPLPFMFGTRAETIKARYWIRPLQAEQAGEYCLEAVPKTWQDAQNFKMVQIVLDEKQYLPIRMQVFERDWSPVNPHRVAYRFDDRQENEPNTLKGLLDPLNIWTREFFQVETPRGWKRIVYNANNEIISGGNTAALPQVGPGLK